MDYMDLSLLIFIPLVVVVFGLLPFVNFYLFPLFAKPVKKDESGAIEMSHTNQSGVSSFVEEEGGYRVKRAEGVGRVDLLLVYKHGLMKMKKRYHLEFASNEIVLPKSKKGVLVRVYVTKVDGYVKNSKYARGVNFPFLIICSAMQIGTLFGFALSLAYYGDSTIERITGAWLNDAIPFYVWPIVISLVVPIVFFFLTLLALKLGFPKKEVK